MTEHLISRKDTLFPTTAEQVVPEDTYFLFRKPIVQDSWFFFFDCFASGLKILKIILH